MKLLRQAGDYPNKSVVEYATVEVRIPNELLPSNLQHTGQAGETPITLSVSPSGRLTNKTLYLNSVELTERFAAHLANLFDSRKYAGHYELRVCVMTTTKTTTATKGKVEHSARVAEVLASAD